MSTEPNATPAPVADITLPAPAPFVLEHTSPTVPPVETDRDGAPFDSAVHTGRKDKNGRWERIGGPRRAGRPPGSKTKKTPAESKPAAAEAPPPDFSDVDKIANAVPVGPDAAPGTEAPPVTDAKAFVENATVETSIGIIQTALVLIGDDEGILSSAEKELLRGPLTRIMRKYEMAPDAMPVELDLAVVMAGLVITRLKKPKTATTYEKVKAWAINKWFRRKGAALASEMREHVTTAP